MNLGTALGFITAIVVVGLSVWLAVDNPLVFVDYKSALIVIGGTVAATLICFPTSEIVAMLKVFVKRIFGKTLKDYPAIIEEIVALAKAKLQGKKAFEAASGQVKDLFLRDGAAILSWSKSEISNDELRDLLETRANTHYRQYHDEAKIFKTVSKFPPAFGLLGTTLGMVALLQGLSEEGALERLGPAMAIALITTIYGLVAANLLVVPVAENLAKQTEEDAIARTLVVEGLMLIQEDKPPRYIEEKLNSFLLPSQRKDAA